MNRKKVALLLNILIIIFELIGFILTIKENGRLGIEFYTEDSNILAFFTSIIFIIYIILNKKISSYLEILKYASTVCLTVTFLVVIIILAPMYNFNYGFLLFHNELLYHHLLCPLLSIITFIWFDDLQDYNILDNIIVTLVTILYGIILVVLNIFKIVDGPYPFLKINNQSIFMSIFWAILILSMAYIIALLIRKIKYFYKNYK